MYFFLDNSHTTSLLQGLIRSVSRGFRGLSRTMSFAAEEIDGTSVGASSLRALSFRTAGRLVRSIVRMGSTVFSGLDSPKPLSPSGRAAGDSKQTNKPGFLTRARRSVVMPESFGLQETSRDTRIERAKQFTGGMGCHSYVFYQRGYRPTTT